MTHTIAKCCCFPFSETMCSVSCNVAAAAAAAVDTAADEEEGSELFIRDERRR